MRISIAWLNDFVETPPLADLCACLTNAGIEVEYVRDPQTACSGVVVAEVVSCERHPESERLTVCRVFDGAEHFIVVCGAPNVKNGQHVAFARPGAFVQNKEIGKLVIRGVESAGMICSLADLGLTDSSEGIWELNKDILLGSKALQSTGAVLELGITPNRPDLLSHAGIAREVAAATGKRMRSPRWHLLERGPDTRTLAKVLVDDPKGCPKYVARVLRNVKVGPSPKWLQDRLEMIGQRPINNVVDVTNYVLFELGQPLHAFDLDNLSKHAKVSTIRVRRAVQGEKATTLDGVERELSTEDVLVTDDKQCIALAGVMGALNSEVQDTTTTVLLESAHFDPVCVRRTAKRQNLSTEASYRFERGSDPDIATKAIDRCAQLLTETANAEVAKGAIDISIKTEPPVEISLRIDRVSKCLGINLGSESIVQLLDPLGIRCVARSESALRFRPPSFRPDLSREIDLVEELARRNGYDNIPMRLPDASGPYFYVPPLDDVAEVSRRVMLACGASEAVTWGFGSPSVYCEYDSLDYGKPVRLQNPLGEELSVLRTSLMPGLLSALSRNQRHGERTIRLFEIGTTFQQKVPSPEEDEKDRHLPREVTRLAFVLSGGRHGGTWYEHGEQIDFSDLAGVLESLERQWKLEKPLLRRPVVIASLFHPHVGAEVLYDQKRVGFLAELHPEFSSRQQLQGRVLVGEISLDAIKEIPKSTNVFRGVEKYPGTRRDIALVVDKKVLAEDIRSFLVTHAGGSLGTEIVRSVQLFDVYEGKPMKMDQVSLAFAILYRHADRTLTDTEVNEAFLSVVEKTKQEFSAEIRK